MADANHYSIAKPNAGITGTAGTEPDRPSLRGALRNVHPVRDTLKAVSGAVKKALGKKTAPPNQRTDRAETATTQEKFE